VWPCIRTYLAWPLTVIRSVPPAPVVVVYMSRHDKAVQWRPASLLPLRVRRPPTAGRPSLRLNVPAEVPPGSQLFRGPGPPPQRDGRVTVDRLRGGTGRRWTATTPWRSCSGPGLVRPRGRGDVEGGGLAGRQGHGRGRCLPSGRALHGAAGRWLIEAMPLRLDQRQVSG